MRRKKLLKTCLLFLATTLSLVFLSVGNGYAETLISVIDGHNTCTQCHGRFPGEPGAGKSGKAAPPARIPADKIDLLLSLIHI